MATLRERNRLAAMRETQRAALTLFQDRGFDGVTVDEVATEVGVAASTVYRHFGSKEALVLWDEHDTAIVSALEARLGEQPPFEAIRDAFVETLAGRYDGDLEFQLARIRYIYATEAVHAAAVEADYRNRAELADALRLSLSPPDRGAAGLLAAAALLALDLAMEAWQDGDGARPLAGHITEAFEHLARLPDLA